MANLSEDIQCAGFDTQPPMLDRTDFASWQQYIRLYCQGKENGMNILKSIDEGPFQMGTVREPLAEGTEGAPHLGPERPRIYSDLSPEEKDRYNGQSEDAPGRVRINQRRSGITTRSRTNPRGGGAAGYGGVSNRVGYVPVRNANPSQARQVKCYNCNGIGHIARNCTQPKHPQNSDYYKDKMLLMQAQENRVALDEERLLFLAGGQDNAIDEDVDEQPVQDLVLNVDNVFQSDDYDAFDSDHVKDNAMPVVYSIVSSVPNDVYMMIYNDMYEPYAQFVSKISRNTLVENSLTAELATYKEQVKLYERWARVLPTKSQVKIHIFTLIQLFSEFDKTCKKIITPTGLTEGEMGFEPTKECYLKEVIQFFRTLKEHFDGIQKALTKEIKEMKDVFEELEAEVAQNVVDRKHDEIKQKNLLIVNDNLIAECLSIEVFSVATNSELNVARFTKMHVAHTIVEARCLELEAELSNLRGNSHSDNHNELVNRFSNLEVHHLNLQSKYQNFKDSFGNNPPTPAKDTPDFDSVFIIRKMQASLQGKENVIKQLKKQISYLQETHSEADRNLNVRGLDSQITQLTIKITVLQAQNDLFRAKNEKIK
nr:hypothetical protein [Tanacetum cinerariifolium]